MPAEIGNCVRASYFRRDESIVKLRVHAQHPYRRSVVVSTRPRHCFPFKENSQTSQIYRRYLSAVRAELCDFQPLSNRRVTQVEIEGHAISRGELMNS